MLKVVIAVIAALSVSACLFNKKEEAPAEQPAAEQTAPAEAAPAQPEAQPAPAE